MSHRLGFNGYSTADAAPVSTSSVIPSPGESGVYDNYSTRIARALPSAWSDDDDEQATRARSAQPELGPNTLLPTQPLQGRRAPLWQVALQLRGDELSRLWRRNANHLAGRIFVWSDHSGQWIRLHASSDALPGVSPQVFLPPQSNDPTRGTSRTHAAMGNRSSGEPVDLTGEARPQLFRLPRRITRGWALGLAASFLTVVAVAALLPGKARVDPAAATQAGEQNRSTEEKSHTVVTPSKSDIVAVESLPLVSAQPRKFEHRAHVLNPNPVSNTNPPNAAVTRSSAGFSPTLARQALARAASRAGHCSSGDVSGSVQVTYEPSGAVSDVALSALVGDVSGSACVVNSFRAARIAPFQGSRVTVRKSFSSHG